MKFLEMLKNKIAVRYLIFGLLLFGFTIGASYIDSANDVEATFGSSEVKIKSDYYQMTIRYEDIARAELVQLPDAGTVVDGKDTMVLRYGAWTNDVWGKYYICADLDCTNCIAVYIHDGRVLVFSSKNNATTEMLYEQLQSYISEQ